MQPNQFFSLEPVIDRQPITVSGETSLKKVISLMQEWGNSCSFIDGEEALVADTDVGSNNSCVLVVEGNRLRGIFTERDLVKLVATGVDTQSVTVGEIMTQKIVTLTPTGDKDIFTALSLLKEHNIRHLPVVSDRQNIIGLITAKNLRQKLQPLDLMKWRTVSEVMETGVVYAAADDSVQSIAMLMANHNISCVAIAELEEDPQTNSSWVRPIGIITERDIVQFQNLSLDLGLPAHNLMSAPLFLVSPEDSLWDINQQMQQRRIRRFLVANERGELQGIITQSSLLQLFDPAELYGSLEILQRQVCQLETKRERLLQQYNSELEQEVQKTTAVIATKNQQLQQRIRQQQAVAEFGKFALSDPTLEAIIDRAVNLVTNILEVEYCKVDTLFLKAGVGWQDGLVGTATLGIDENCQARYALQQSQPVIVDDLRTETRFGAPSLLINHQVISGMSVIILDGAKPFGVIGTHTRQHRVFTQDDINFLCAIANIIAQANERQQAESALREREELFRVLVTSAPVGIFQTNAQGDCLYVNQKWQEMTGLTTQQALGQGWIEALHPSDRDLIFAEWYEAAQTAKEFSLESRFITPQGQITWVEGKAVPLYDETGEISGYLATVTDISDRKQAEVAIDADLRDTQRLLDLSARLLSEADTQVLYNEIVATAIALTRADGGSCQILDEATQELVLLSTQGFDRTMTEHFYRVPASSNTSCGIALATTARTFVDFDVPPSADLDGSLRMHVNAGYLSAQSTPLITCSGKPIGMLSTHWHNQHRPSDRELRFLDLLARQAADLIEQRQAEVKIREQAALLDVATDAIMVRDLDDIILFWNQGAEKLYGWTKQETINKQANELFYRKSQATKTKLDDIQQKIREKGEWQGELNQITKAGKKITVESRWTLVKDEANNLLSYLIVNTDITEQKQLEAQFLRTQRLESLGTLAGGIAHDLNNILNPILGFSRLLPLRLPDLDEKTKGFFKIMENNANRGSALVKQILAFSRGLDGERGIVQIRHLITEVGQIINETFPKSIELVTNVPKNLWTVNADVNQLHQILMNLAVNARDAMPDGGTLTIDAENMTVDAEYARLHLDALEGSYVLISVTDTGMGIPAEIIDRIFEPFFTTKETGRGTGLGLSTVIGIVKSHGGFVDVTSDRLSNSGGTQFKVFLPASDIVASNLEEPAEILQGNGELILVVDDETAILEVTQATLETYNYRVLTASNGIEAIATYAQNQGEISLAIVDIMMPTMDGKKAIRVLKQLNPELKIIAVSGLIDRQEIIAELDGNVTAFINKPYGNDDLLRTISEILSSERT
jgi:PAS domain S-box-containing protein